MRPFAALLLLALAPACLIEYAIGGGGATTTSGSSSDTSSASPPTTGGCPEGQALCGDSCAPVGACDDCPQGQVKCDDTCVPAGSCTSDCPEGQIQCDGACVAAESCGCAGCDPDREVCEDGACTCRAGLTRCGETCVDTRADAAHCGECDKDCGDGVCSGSQCVEGCKETMTACGGACVDTESHPLHCGDCGQPCQADELCFGGSCRQFSVIDGCQACPCEDACGDFDTAESGDAGSICCDSEFVNAPVCTDSECS